MVIVLFGLALLAFAVGGRMLEQYDLPWHLALGRMLVAERGIPAVDPFSFAQSELRYVSVVSDLLLYGLWQVGGPLALQLFGAALALALAAILISLALEVDMAGLPLAALGLFAMFPWFGVRPATISFLFCAGLLALIELHRNHPTERIGKLGLGGALLLVLLWANVHSGGVLAVMILFLYAAHRTAASYLAARFPNLLPASDAGHLLWPWITAGLAPLLTLVNPAGFEYFSGVAKVGPYVKLISEWTPTSIDYFVKSFPAVGAFLVICVLALLFGREPSGSRIPPLYSLGLIGGVLLLITVKRFVPLVIIILTPVVARRLGGLFRELARTRVLLASTVALAGFSAVAVDPASYGLDRTFGVGWEPRNFPEAAVAFVEKADLKGNMWNFFPYGGYLIWRLYPKHRVLLDGRIGVVTYETDYVLRAMASEIEDAPFQKLAVDYDLQWAFCFARTDVWRSCRPVARDPEWAMVYWDDMAAVYVKRNGPNHALAERGYRVFRHLMRPEELVDAALRGIQRENTSHDSALARSQAPESTRALFLDAVGALAVDDRERFFSALQKLGELAPYHPALPVLLQLVPQMRGAPATKTPPQP